VAQPRQDYLRILPQDGQAVLCRPRFIGWCGARLQRGRQHGDLSKKTKAETLEASLFAAFNIDWCAAYRAAHPSRALLPLPV